MIWWFKFLSLFATVAMAVRRLETDALLSCSQESQVQASNFKIVFFPDNSTAYITTNIISSITGNFTASINVVVYGINIITKNITNCEIADTLCPMGAGHFDVDTTYKLSSNQITNQVPGIAYTFPDIDAVVTVNVYQQDEDGNVLDGVIACVQAQVSNTKTVQTQIASWVLFGMCIFFLFVAGIMGLRGYFSTTTHIIADIMGLFGYFQAVAIFSMMAVQRLPPIASAWAQNFMWTVGIMRLDWMQDVLSWYVRSTGGSPTVVIANKELLSVAVYRRASQLAEIGRQHFERLVERVPGSAKRLLAPMVKRYVSSNSDYITTNEHDSNLISKTLLLTGIKRVAFKANIEITNLFLTGIVFFVFIGLILVAIMVVTKLMAELLSRTGAVRAERFVEYRSQWKQCTKGVMNRYFLVAFPMTTVLCLYEFVSRNSTACIVDAAFIYAVVLAALIWASVKVILLARESTKLFKNPAYILYGNAEILSHWGFLYVQYRANAYYFLVPVMVANFVRSAVIALGQGNGKVQAVILFVLELIYLVAVCVLKPYMDKKTNGIYIAIAVVMFLNSILFLLFSQIFPHTNVASPIAAVVFFILNAIFSAGLVISIIISCLWAMFKKDPDARYQPMKDDRAAFRQDARDNESNELADMADAARDGYRESFLRNEDSESIYHEPSSSFTNSNSTGKNNEHYRPYESGYRQY